MKNVQASSSERFKKLSNVIATLLHIGMVNIGSDNEELRVASYELLCSVCTYLDFEGKPVVPTKGNTPLHRQDESLIYSRQLSLSPVAQAPLSLNSARSSPSSHHS